jgi:hypothetical protein
LVLFTGKRRPRVGEEAIAKTVQGKLRQITEGIIQIASAK